MRAALAVARELLRCRLMESGRCVLLERVAELLDATASGALPFCYPLPSQAVTGTHGGPRRNHAPSGAHGGFVNTSAAGGAGGSPAPVPPTTSMGTSVASHGPSGMPRYHPQDATLGRATWSVGHYGEVFGPGSLRAPHDGPGVTASVDGTGAAASFPPGETRWGLCGGSQEQAPSPRCAKPSDVWR
nr:uncharacterized protein LOC109732065 [Aegilops tauschii subsp. strangulata]